MQVGSWQVDPTAGLLRNGRETKHLPPRNMAVLVYLAERPGQIVSADELLTALWPNPYSSHGAVQKVISELRTALDDNRQRPRYIETLSKRGYRFIASVDQGAERSGRRAHRSNRPFAAILGLVIVGLIGGIWWYAGPTGTLDKPRVVVRPLAVLGSDEAAETIAEIARARVREELAATAELELVSREATGGSEDYGVEGSVRIEDGVGLVSLVLIAPRSGLQFWSQTYPVPPEDYTAGRFPMGPKAGRLITGMISNHGRAENASTRDEAAKAHYLAGLRDQTESTFDKEPDFELRLNHWTRAVELDPDFLEAHHMLAYLYSQRVIRSLDHLESQRLAHKHIEAALRIAPEHPVTYLALGQINIQLDHDYVAAEANFEKARSVPNLWGLVEGQLATMSLMQGRHDVAVKHYTRATRESPFDYYIVYVGGHGHALLYDGKTHSAIEVLRKGMGAIAGAGRFDDWLASGLIRAYHVLGDEKSANKILDELLENNEGAMYPGLHATLGWDMRARAELRTLEEQLARGGHVQASHGMFGYAHLGELDNAFRWINRGIDDHDLMMFIELRSGLLPAALENDPRFAAALERLDVMERAATSVDAADRFN